MTGCGAFRRLRLPLLVQLGIVATLCMNNANVMNNFRDAAANTSHQLHMRASVAAVGFALLAVFDLIVIMLVGTEVEDDLIEAALPKVPVPRLFTGKSSGQPGIAKQFSDASTDSMV